MAWKELVVHPWRQRPDGLWFGQYSCQMTMPVDDETLKERAGIERTYVAGRRVERPVTWIKEAIEAGRYIIQIRE